MGETIRTFVPYHVEAARDERGSTRGRAQLDLKMANFRNKEQEEIVREVLGIQPIIIGSFFTLLILSCLLIR